MRQSVSVRRSTAPCVDTRRSASPHVSAKRPSPWLSDWPPEALTWVTVLGRLATHCVFQIALNWSPWYDLMPGKMGPADARYAGPEEAESMASYSALLANASHALAALNVRHSSAVKIGAVVLDSEKYEYCDHHNDSATGKAYDSCAESVWKALTRKNNLVYSASKAAFPDAFVMQYLLRRPSNPR